MNRSLRLLAALTLTGSGLTVWSSSPGAAADTLVAQSTYYCDASASSTSDDPSSANYNATARLQIDGPPSVQPGQTVNLGGVLTLQFDEALYQNARLVGVTTIDGYSDTMSMTTTVNGRKSVLMANRWQTPPMQLQDPIVVSAPITFKPFTVPADAAGAIELGLMQNGTTDNSVDNSPATVAFTAIANAKYGGGEIIFKLACYLTSGTPGSLGRIPVTAKAATPVTAPESGAASTSTGAPPTLTTVGPAGGSKPGASATTTLPGLPSTEVVDPGAVTASVDSAPGAVPAAAPTPTAAGGVYLPTGLLVLGGAAVCFAALSYAALSNYRLRMIRRALEE